MNVKNGIATIVTLIVTSGGVLEVTTDNSPVNVIKPGEIVTERTVNATVYDLGNGQRRAKVYSAPIHYKEGNEYKTIDLNIKKKPPLSALISKYEYECNSGLYHAHFDTEKPWNHRVEFGDEWIEYEALFELTASLKIDMETTKLGVKETITLLDDKAPSVFKWVIASSGKLFPEPPTAIDAAGNYVPVSETTISDTLIYVVNVDNAIYPIEIDPTTIEATDDGTAYCAAYWDYSVVRDHAGSNSHASLVRVGQGDDGGGNRYIYRGFLSFVIPALQGVTTCSLFLYGDINYSGVDFGIYLGEATYTAPISDDDYTAFTGRQVGSNYTGDIWNDTWWSWDYIDADFNEFVFNATGRAAVYAASESTLKVIVISKEDYGNSAPASGTQEEIIFSSSSDSGEEPYLSLTYVGVLDISGIGTVVEVSGISYTEISGIAP